MKKKISVFMLVAALTCSTVLSAFAAGSKTITVEEAKTSTGAAVTVATIAAVEEAGIDEAGVIAEDVKETFVDIIKTFVAAAPELFPALPSISAPEEDAAEAEEEVVVNVEVVSVFDVEVPEIAENETVDIEFTLDTAIADGETPIVMHFNGTEWEALPTVVVSPTVIKATFSDFSPVAIVTVTETPAEPVADKTADAVAFVAIVALVAAGALVINRKRVNA